MFRVIRWVGVIGLGLVIGLALLWLTGGNSTATPVRSVATPVPAAGPSSTPTPGVSSVSSLVTPTTLPPVVAPPPSPGIGSEYLALGDSVAYGIGAPDPVNGGYAGIFYANYLKRVQPDLQSYRNLAVPGETSTSFVTASRGNKSQLQRALDEIDAAGQAGRRVSPLTLTIGGNDLLNMQGKSQPEREAILATFEANDKRILDELRGRLGQVDLIVTTYYNPQGSEIGTSELGWLQRLNDVIKREGTAHGAKIADFYPPVLGQEKSLTWDGVGDVHPTSAGHAILAQTLWAASGYDRQPPTVAITYSPVMTGGTVGPNSRLTFQVSAQDEAWRATVGQFDTPGAGVVAGLTARLDKGGPLSLLAVPARYTRQSGVQEWSYLLDTSGLEPGPHTLRFDARDVAGNIGSVELNFQVSS